MYQVIQDNTVINEFESILDAYLYIDSTAIIKDFLQYYNELIFQYKNINDFTSTLFNELSELNNQLNNLYINFEENNIDNIKILFPFEQEKYYLIINHEKFLSSINFILQTYNSEYKIQKSEYTLNEELKQYFYNNISEFLNITNQLIDNNLYTTYLWQKNLNKDAITIDNNIELQYDEKFNINDVYNYIEAGIIYSANEYAILQLYINDIDNIINIINNNIIFLNKLNISLNLKRILSKG